jgi:hypothetical protein
MKMDDTRAFVPLAIAKKIAAIEPTARRLGWPVARLFDPNLDDHRRPCGLASVLELDDTIEAVRRDVIVICKNAYHTLKFPRS